MCRRRAEQELASVGDPSLGEWREWSGYAYHLRRRLTAAEQERVGPVVDVRLTEEARRRALALGHLLTLVPSGILHGEVGDLP